MTTLTELVEQDLFDLKSLIVEGTVIETENKNRYIFVNNIFVGIGSWFMKNNLDKMLYSPDAGNEYGYSIDFIFKPKTIYVLETKRIHKDSIVWQRHTD